MRAFILDPLVAAGALMGLNRPLDRHDFGGHIPDSFMERVPKPGAFHGLNWGGQGFGAYEAVCSNLSVVAGSQAAAVDIYGTDTVQRHPLGTLAITRDGRMFRYATAGAVALVVGEVIQSSAPIANHLALTSAAQSVGDGGPTRPIVVTPGATAGAANLYAEGTLQISTTPGLGQVYRIAGHAAISSATAFNLYLDPDDTLQTALTTATRYGLFANPWKNVIETPTTLTAPLAGVAISAIPANTTSQNYGWLQTRGPASVLINGTPGVGVLVMNSATTAGAVDVITTTNLVTSNIVGRMMQVGVSTKNNGVYLLID